MNKETFIQELKELFAPYFTEAGLELVDVIYRHDGARLIVTVLGDRPQGGITLEECARICRRLRDLLEEKNIINCDYSLEVSSPGLDRPLKNRNDFLRNLNKEAVFFLNDLVDGKCQWQGVIKQADDAKVLVQTGKGLLEISLAKINKSQLII